jgi:hypothetical protein
MNQFPSINERNKPKNLFEPHIPSPLVQPRNSNKSFINGPDFSSHDFSSPDFSSPDFNGSDYFPDFSVKIDIEAESIQLSLNTLGMTRAEFNSMSIRDLWSKKRIDCDGNSSCALNILIYYKQNTKSFLPQFSPIQYKNNWTGFNKNKINNVKIYPELNKFDDMV